MFMKCFTVYRDASILPNILLMLELCISGKACNIFLLSVCMSEEKRVAMKEEFSFKGVEWTL